MFLDVPGYVCMDRCIFLALNSKPITFDAENHKDPWGGRGRGP